jgi:hypothetical protein
MRITTRKTISMLTGETLEHVFYEYNGPLDKTCGATPDQVADEKAQQSLMHTMADQAKQEFGSASSVFQDLYNTFAPTVKAGPNQNGFSAPEKAALDSGAITNTGQAYRNASTAVKEANAAVGGGNIALPSGSEVSRNIAIANAGAERTAGALNQIDQTNYEVGRQQYDKAVAGLESAPSVFGTSNQGGSVGVSAGSAAANTANQIAQEDNGWVSAVTGALGGVAGAAVTGGMKSDPLPIVGQGPVPLYGG